MSNIQAETAETVNTMNMAISQVVQGSQLAEQAGAQMQDTQSHHRRACGCGRADRQQLAAAGRDQ